MRGTTPTLGSPRGDGASPVGRLGTARARPACGGLAARSGRGSGSGAANGPASGRQLAAGFAAVVEDDVDAAGAAAAVLVVDEDDVLDDELLLLAEVVELEVDRESLR